MNPSNEGDSYPTWIRRKRLQRFWITWLRTLPALFFGFAFICAIAWIIPLSFPAILIASSGIFLFSLAFAFLAFFRSLPRNTVLRDIDQHLEIDDLTITVGDDSLEKGWRRLLGFRLQPHLTSVKTRRIWPLNSTPLQKIWIGACLLMGANVFLTAAAVRPEPTIKIVVAAENTVSFEEMLDDWEEVASEVPSEEFQAMLEEIENLREETDPAQQTTAERMELLSKIEAIVEKHRRSQSEASISEHADDLAALLESVEGMSGAAAALRRGDFSEAGQSLEEMAASLMNSEELPPGTTSESLQRRAEELSRVAAEKGNTKLSKSLKELSEAAKNQDAAGWCESAGALGDSMTQEGARSLADSLMQAQLDQLEAQKLALSQGTSNKPPTLSALMQGLSPGAAGLQVGTGPGGEPFGAPTQPNGELETLALSGSPGQGDSTIETIRSNEAPTEATRVGGQATFEEYQALSTQAIHDESLPLVHRETIRRYFERIRPQTTEN